MNKIVAYHRSALSLSGICCLLAVLGLLVLPAKSFVRADDSDSSKASSQKDKDQDKDKDKDRDSNSADRRDNQNRQDGQNRRDGRNAWIGVRLQEDGNSPTPVDHKDGDRSQKGVEATAIYPNGPAARGGLRQGDRIEKINGKAVTSSKEVTEAVRDLQPGAKIEIVVFRNGNEQTLTIMAGDGAMFRQGGGPGNQQQQSFSYGGNQQGFPQGGYYQQGFPQGGYQQNGYQQQGGYAQGNNYDGIPEHAMMLEYNRRNSEQHQRMESQIEELLQEIKSLRKEIQQLKAK